LDINEKADLVGITMLTCQANRGYELGDHFRKKGIPTISGGRIYLGINDTSVSRAGYRPSGGGAVLCVDLATRQTVWQLPIPRYMAGVQPPYHFDQWKCGVCSGPLVAGDRVYVAGNRGDVLCFDREGQANRNGGPFMDELAYMGVTGSNAVLEASDGDILWRFDVLKEIDAAPHDTCASTLLLVDGLLFVGTSNGVDGGHTVCPRPDAPMLAVLDAKTGRLVAQDDERTGRRLLHGGWSSPCLGEAGGKKIILMGGGDGWLYAFDVPVAAADGRVQTLRKIWAADCNPPHFRLKDGQPLAYSSWGHRLPDGPSEPIATPVFEGGRVYVAIGQSPLHGLGNGCLSCFDAATGAVVWRTEALNRTLSTVALWAGVIYLPDSAGELHAFDAATGAKLWSHNLDGPVNYANARVADGKVYVGTEQGDFWIFRAGREKAVLSHTRLPSPPVTVSVTDGKLCIPLQNRLSVFGRQP
ncbi:MAG: PQQ-binding-like beta-propeller repeat protein, partial [bacterium]